VLKGNERPDPDSHHHPSDFDSTVAAAVSLGLQVAVSDPAYELVVGFLPSAQLPAAAAITGAPALAAVDYPITR